MTIVDFTGQDFRVGGVGGDAAGVHDEALLEALTEMQGGRRSRGVYVVPARWPVVVRLSEIVPREHWSAEALQAAMTLAGEARFLGRLAGSKEGSQIEVPGSDRPTPVQMQGAVWLEHGDAKLLCDEMGSGKTVQACVAMDRISFMDSFRALVVCPASVVGSWAAHVARWTEGVVPVVLAGPVKKRREALAEALEEFSHFALVCSWQMLSRMSRVAHWPTVERTPAQAEPKELNGIEFDLLVLDEAHRGKNPESLQTRASWEIDAARRWALTGTPVAERPEDYWALLRQVDAESWPSKRKFVDEFCETEIDDWGTVHVKGWRPDRLGRLSRYVTPYYRRMTMEDAIGRGIDKVRQRRVVALPKAHREQYETIAKEWKVVAEESESWTPNALSRLTRLMQCALSPLEIEGNGVRLTGPSPKVAELRALLKEDLPPDEQVVVFTASRQLHTLAAEMMHRQGIRHVTLTGGTSPADRQLRIERFQAGEARVFLATTQAAGEGVDLTAARTVVHLSKLWSMFMTAQAEDRVRRFTQDSDVVRIVDIVAENTIEGRIEKALADKGELLEAITPKDLI